MKTFSNVGNAKRAAKKAGLDITTLNFITVDGRTSWTPKEEAVLTALVIAATTKEEVVITTAKEETGKIPEATIKGQGSLNVRRTHNGFDIATKSGRVRRIILNEFNVDEPNVEHCIALIRKTEGFNRNLGRVYFANNLPKVFPQFAVTDKE